MNQWRWKYGVMSAVSTKLVQLMTGFATTAARKRSVLPTIHAVSTPPPEPAAPVALLSAMVVPVIDVVPSL